MSFAVLTACFDLESYCSREIARRIGTKEEQAFMVGDGTGKPAVSSRPPSAA
jgi:HK97 family phage major capsid protein